MSDALYKKWWFWLSLVGAICLIVFAMWMIFSRGTDPVARDIALLQRKFKEKNWKAVRDLLCSLRAPARKLTPAEYYKYAQVRSAYSNDHPNMYCKAGVPLEPDVISSHRGHR